MITTDVSNRFSLLDQTVNSLLATEKVPTQKILSVDLIEKKTNPAYFKKYADVGFEVLISDGHPKLKMIGNILKAFPYIKNDFLFYCEDDVIIDKQPSADFYNYASKQKDFGGLLYNTHLCEHSLDIAEKRLSDYNNYLSIKNELLFLKSPSLKDNYYICYPACIIKTDLYKNMIIEAAKKNGKGIEPASSAAWFELGYEKYKIYNYIQNRNSKTQEEFYYNACMQFWNNNHSLRHDSILNRENSII